MNPAVKWLMVFIALCGIGALAVSHFTPAPGQVYVVHAGTGWYAQITIDGRGVRLDEWKCNQNSNGYHFYQAMGALSKDYKQVTWQERPSHTQPIHVARNVVDLGGGAFVNSNSGAARTAYSAALKDKGGCLSAVLVPAPGS